MVIVVAIVRVMGFEIVYLMWTVSIVTTMLVMIRTIDTFLAIVVKSMNMLMIVVLSSVVKAGGQWVDYRIRSLSGSIIVV